MVCFFFSSRRRHTILVSDWSSDVCSSDLDGRSPAAETKGVTLTTSVPAAGDRPSAEERSVVVHADRTRLEQVAANLLDNAIKYTPAGGRVDVETRRDGSEALLIVRDTGPGIAPAELPRIWDRLFRGDASRSERGLGLGLSLVKAIVEAHGGTVAVISELGHGATFTVRLPVITRM